MSSKNFKILEKDIPEAFSAVMKVKPYYQSPEAASKKIKHFQHLPPLEKLVEIADYAWGIRFDVKDGEIVGTSFEWEKYTSAEKDLFEALAPYVVDGSYLEWNGEDGTKWRFVFTNGKMEEKWPRIEWDFGKSNNNNNDNPLLAEFATVLNIYQDIEDAFSEGGSPPEKLRKIKEANNCLGMLCKKVLPG